MKVTQKTTRKNVLYMILVLVTGFSAIAAYIMLSGVSHANESSNRFAEYYIAEQKKAVKIEVENRLDEIEYELDNLKKEELILLKNKIAQIAYLLERSDANNIADIKERQTAILEEYRTLTIFDNDSYFAIDTKGVLLKSTTNNDSLVEIDMYDAVDEQGVYYVRKMLKAVNVREGVYVSYLYPKAEGEEPVNKTSYCLYLPAYDIIIGTGVFDIDIQNSLKEEMLARLQSYYEDQSNYIFVTDYDSTSRVTANADVVGTKMDTFTTADGENLHQIFIETAQKSDDNYLTYKYYKRGEDVLSEKTSYIKAIDEWDCYIGMGFHIDDLTSEIDDYTKAFKRFHYIEMLYVILGLVFVAVLIYILVKRGAYLQKTYLEQEEVVFTKLIELSNESILIVSNDNEILYFNVKTKVLFGNNVDDYVEQGKLKVEEIEPGIFVLENNSGRIYYVEVKKEKILYHGTDSTIYFINNITTTYTKSNEFEKLTLINELSGLPNRRALINDFEEKYHHKEDVNTIIGIIDLDNFKDVNDKHGHDVGDEVIRILGEIFKFRLRQTDSLYRYGGEEFIVMLESTNLKSAQRILMDINGKFDEEVQRCLGFSITFSGGVTKIDADTPCVLNDYIKKADKLLYEAKNNGKNRIEI